MEHPVCRFVVLAALSPLEAFAWLCLNPMWYLCLFGGVGNCKRFSYDHSVQENIMTRKPGIRTNATLPAL